MSKVVICGGRTLRDMQLVRDAIKASGFTITEVVSGTQLGADTLGKQWADENGIPVKPFPPDWQRYGTSAGPIRNQQMGDYCDAVIAIWNGKSTGTKSMIGIARKKNKPLYIHKV